jgi:lipoprotein-anchoring transpeptidase ErfK/SrfK
MQRRTRTLAACIAAAGTWACGQAEPNPSGDGAAASTADDALFEGLAAVPVPDEDGPKLAPRAMRVPILALPKSGSTEVGYLRLGTRVSRSEEPVSTQECPGGWYAVRPLGFVCQGELATTDLDEPLVRGIAAEPDRNKPMPYAYAFVRAVAPNYLRIPTKEEQFEKEMRLDRHLRSWQKLKDEWDALEVGANDVPLDGAGHAIGAIPDHAKPLGESERFGGNGNDEVPFWLQGGKRALPNVSSFKAPPYAIMADRVKRHAGVALIGSFLAPEAAQGRRFAISTDLRLLPADKLKADSGSPFHGSDIREVGLPVAFARKAGATRWHYEKGELDRGNALGFRELVPLSGKQQQIAGEKMVQARDGSWLKSADLKTAVRPSKLPWFAAGTRRWISVSLISQTMVLYEGNRPVYATLVSTGRDGLGDPKSTLSTPQGTFRIFQKHVTTTMDSEVAEKEFELRDVPWVMYFQGSYALHGAYWHDDFGRPRSHGCINLAPIDARIVFEWSSPEVPEHWHGANAGDDFGEGTIVQVGP